LKVEGDADKDLLVFELDLLNGNLGFSLDLDEDQINFTIGLVLDIKSLSNNPVTPVEFDTLEFDVELDSDLFDLVIVIGLPLKSEGINLEVNVDFDIGGLDVDVIVHLELEFMDDGVGMIFEITTGNGVFVFPEGNLDIVINVELMFDFSDQLDE
jgi:hypothetical protein